MNTLTTSARENGRLAVQQSLPVELWNENEKFTRSLVEELKQHPFNSHPLLKIMNDGDISLAWLKDFYVETVQVLSGRFLEYVLQAILNCQQLEKNLGVRGVAAARFLFQINAIDELGFSAEGSNGDFTGTPKDAHAIQLFNTMEEIGIPEADINNHLASSAGLQLLQVLEANRYSHLELATLLAVYEEVLPAWSEAWAEATKAVTSVNIEEGYHAIHLEDDDGHVVDDDHSEDSWYIVRQALTEESRPKVRNLAIHLLDVMHGYVDHQMGLVGNV